MIISVTNKIGRGELVLPSIGYPVKVGAKIIVGHDKFYTPDVQSALESGYLELVDGSLVEGVTPRKKFKVKNLKGGPLGVSANISFLKGEVKFLSEEQFSEVGVQEAIKIGWLEYSVQEGVKKVEKKNENVQEKIKTEYKKKKTKKKSRSQKKAEKKAANDFRPQDPQTTMRAWKADTSELIDKEATSEAVMPNKAKPVATSDLEEHFDNLKETVVKVANRRKAKSSQKRVTKPFEGKSKKGLKPVGRQRKEKNANDIVVNEDLPNESQMAAGDIDFVDEKQERERIEKHPLLRRTIARQNEEVE